MAASAPPPSESAALQTPPGLAAPTAPRWTVRLLGAIEAECPQRSIRRWPTRAVAALLARLALAPDRQHPREELVELLWPGVALEVGRNRLRQALSTLKGLLEADAGAPLIQADRLALRLAPGMLDCDVRDFEQALRAGDFERAGPLYRGELMPGFYEDWVIDERGRLGALFERVEGRRAGGAGAALAIRTTPATRADQANAAPALASPGQLPNFWTRLFGIQGNASRLRELVRQQRLVTVFGAGGSGKTRLAVEACRALGVALEVASQTRLTSQSSRSGQPSQLNQPGQSRPASANSDAHAPGFDRIAFVSLVDCADAGLALDAIASALGIAGRDPLARIASALAGQRTLLVLDNFEQLVGLADAALLRLLTDNAHLHLLVTSRQRLGLDGEQVFELAGLPLLQPAPSASIALSATSTTSATSAPSAPSASLTPSVTPLAEESPAAADSPGAAPAVALFMDRARAARAGWQIDAPDQAAVLELVQRLSGMPLAIELAAARMRSLSPRTLLALLTEGETPMLDLLTRDSNVHSLAQRHASMRHVVGWSWRQLSPPLIDMMGALATFSAPARDDTLAAVAGLDVRTARQRLELLRDASLVLAHPDGNGAPRYMLLQPVREYVAERQDAASAAALRARLRQWLIGFGQRCAARGHLAIAEVEAELVQVHAGILGAVADGAHHDAVAIAVGLRRHWEVDTRAGLPLSVMKAVEIAQADLQDAGLRCEACVLLAFSNVLAGFSVEALGWAETALALAPDARRRAHALMRWGHVVIFSNGDHSSVDAPLAEAVLLAREVGDLEALGLTLRVQLLVAVNRDDDHVRGELLAQQVQALWEQLGHRRNAYGGLMDRATCWIAQGRLTEAATALLACEDVARQEHHATGTIMASWQLGRVSVRLRQADAALAAFRRCVQDSWQHHRLAYVADALVLVPGGLVLTGQLDDAARLQGFAVAHWQRQFGDFYRDLKRDVRFTRRLLLKALGAARLEALRLEGACLSLPDAVALALGHSASAAANAAANGSINRPP